MEAEELERGDAVLKVDDSAQGFHQVLADEASQPSVGHARKPQAKHLVVQNHLQTRPGGRSQEPPFPNGKRSLWSLLGLDQVPDGARHLLQRTLQLHTVRIRVLLQALSSSEAFGYGRLVPGAEEVRGVHLVMCSSSLSGSQLTVMALKESYWNTVVV